MNFYNKYIRKDAFNLSLYRKEYIADIAFVEIDGQSIVKRVETYIKFNKSLHIPNSYYFYKYLGLSEKVDFISKNSDIIQDILQSFRYYSYIKIINDKNNPDLNGKILPFYFGFKINDIIDNNIELLHKNVFRIVVSTVGTFLNFDKCHFTDVEYSVEDKALSLKNKFLKKQFDTVQFRRKLKLKKLKLL